MNFFYFPVGYTNKKAKKHFAETIEHDVRIRDHHDILESRVVDSLTEAGCDTYVKMWGAVAGDSNERNWNLMQSGDVVFVYAEQRWVYYGIVITKTHNPDLAGHIWETDNEGKLFEYTYFLKDLQYIDLSVEHFNYFFGYKNTFSPNGFNRISDEKVNERLREYGNIDKLIQSLTNSKLPNLSEVIAKEKNKEEKARMLNEAELRERAKKGKKEPNRNRAFTTTYERDPYVAMYAKKRARGICQLCEQLAPFEDKNGEPYLETHHIEWLSKGGADTIENTIALCPNCHRKMHSLNLKDDIEVLKKKASK
ncbi:HNH endonuclease [Priestia megaterium]|uniref:HNH endonuclease n=1 Tax=Priestia megaterium TaxID=1404 RepID=UPI002E1FCB78|nr:HNH endonuclease [Priestia megaterium]MED4069582.1 HNH endonuclease [Priestia megaterium]